MLDSLVCTTAAPMRLEADLAAALVRTSAATARLDQALIEHPLLRAFLHRVRLDAVRRQAAVDGCGIDPWHLAATIEGLRLRQDGKLRIIDRGAVLAAARHALTLHQWLHAPDFDQEGDVQRAGEMLAAQTAPTPLLAAAEGMRAWIAAGEARAAMRGALIRFWTRLGVTRAPLPLTGAAAFRAEDDWAPGRWAVAFLRAVADEAEDWLDLLAVMERAWRSARGRVVGRRRTSRAALAVDVMAATPLISPTTLAGAIGMSIKNAGVLLERFCAEGIAVEVTHRSARRLYGLAGLAPLREVVAPPRRAEPCLGRGRPRIAWRGEETAKEASFLPPVACRDFPPLNYDALETAMAFADETIRRTRNDIDAVVRQRFGMTATE